MCNFKDLQEELLKNEEFIRKWKSRVPNWDIADAMIGARIEQNLTQKKFAKKIGVPLAVVRRLERGNGNPSLNFLKRLADRMGMTIRISFEKKEERGMRQP